MQHESDYEQQKSENIDLEDSDENMNESERALFLNIQKSRSNDSFLGKLIGTTPQMEKRPLVINPHEFTVPHLPTNSDPTSHLAFPVPNISIFKRKLKEKKHNKCDYQKNICGYITKKIIREFIGDTYEDFVDELCKKYYCNPEEARKWYLSKVQFVTGPSHIPVLLKPERNDSHDIIGAKFAFRQFFEWFLRERYLRYLMLEGKMTDKKAYIEYKNNVLIGFLEEDRQEIDQFKRALTQQRNEELRLQEELLRVRSLSSNRSKSSRSSRDKNIILTQNNQQLRKTKPSIIRGFEIGGFNELLHANSQNQGKLAQY